MGDTGIGWRHPHYRDLLESLPVLPFLEVHSENFFAQGGAALAVLGQARASYPISLHGVGLALGSACGIDAWHLEQLSALVARIEPVRVSDHACFARGQLAQGQSGGQTVHASDLLPIPFSAEALDVLCANVQQVQDRLQRPLAVENLSAYLTLLGSDSGDMSEPEFLRDLARRTGCHLLVDVNNLYVNALNARRQGSLADPVQACTQWLDAIDPGSVAEIHLAGHCLPEDPVLGLVIDDHGSRVCPEVWTLYAHALRRFGAVPSLIEWDTDIPSLDVLLQEARMADRLAP